MLVLFRLSPACFHNLPDVFPKLNSNLLKPNTNFHVAITKSVVLVLTRNIVKKPKIYLTLTVANMSTGIAFLHKILKDEARRKIVLLLNEKGSLSYTDLMKSLTVSTELLNYHLKVLDDFLSKNGKGEYILTEKGKLASRLLLEFPEDISLGKRCKWERKFWKAKVLLPSVC